MNEEKSLDIKTAQYLTPQAILQNDRKMAIGLAREIFITDSKYTISDDQLLFFLNYANVNGLDPIKHEIELVPFGGKELITYISKSGALVIASRNENYDGFEAGIVVKTDKGIEFIEGTADFGMGEVVGGWAKVFAKNRRVATRVVVDKKNVPYQKWVDNANRNPAYPGIAHMFRKVALARALKEAFPESFPKNILIHGEEPIGKIEEASYTVVDANESLKKIEVKEPIRTRDPIADSMYGEMQRLNEETKAIERAKAESKKICKSRVAFNGMVKDNPKLKEYAKEIVDTFTKNANRELAEDDWDYLLEKLTKQLNEGGI